MNDSTPTPKPTPVTETTIELYTVPKVSAGARAQMYLAMRALEKPKGLTRIRHVASIRKAIVGSSVVDPESGVTAWTDDTVTVLGSKAELETLRNAVLKQCGESADEDAGAGIDFDLVEVALDLVAALDSAMSTVLALESSDGALKALGCADEVDEVDAAPRGLSAPVVTPNPDPSP